MSDSKFSLKFTKIDYFVVFLTILILTTLWIFNVAFLSPLLLGLIFAILTYPIFSKIIKIFQKLLKKNLQPLAAVITIFTISGILFGFIYLFWSQFKRELPNFEDQISSYIQDLPNNPGLKGSFNLTDADAQKLSDSLVNEYKGVQDKIENPNILLKQSFNSDNLGKFLQVGQQTLARLVNFLINLVIFLLAWFYGLTLGMKWQKKVLEVIPFDDEERDWIREDIVAGSRNVIYANLASGALHATICFVIMLVFGVQNKFILTTIIFIIGVLPLSPSELAYAIPITIIFSKNPVAAIVLIPIAEAIILWVNYVLIPKMISSGEDGNPLLILTSILSGITIFGIMGFIIGPVIMIFIQTLYRIILKRLSPSNLKTKKA
ncbi:MAG: AI-2E family transporter [bacterium]